MRNLLVYSSLNPEIKNVSDTKRLLKAPCNIKHIDEAIVLELSIPGYEKSEVNIHLLDNILTVEGQKPTASNVKIVRKGFDIKAFKNVFTLDEKLDAEAISATVNQGLLTLTIPQNPAKSSQTISVK